ncbi:MAG TPA: hypothetical protein ACFYED_02260 [Candidatus Tripitaka californicus]|uniref:hypothetical protein n=1 Tax=Candidatus Tripitaka californicus TaxID=3367616 RepID=UPI0040298F48|nr:hypothetical protein [Planctomycetota bacterium]
MTLAFISDYYRALQKQVQEQILGEKDEVILHSNTDELVEYYFAYNSLSPIEFDPNRDQTLEHKKEMRVVPARRREESYRYEGDLNFEYESIVVTFPILPNKKIQDILALQSSTYSLSGDPSVRVGHDALYLNIDIKGYGFKYDNDKVASEVNRGVDEVKTWIQRKNNDIVKENAQLEQNIRSFVEQRKAKLTEDTQRIASLVQKINIPLKQKENEVVKRIRLDPRPIVKKIKPNPKLPEEYVLDRSKVLDIISVIDNQGRQFEKTPKTYKDFEEEGLRDVILVSLNSLFEGKATGETFSNKGKTDIYLNIDKGNVLICECKIWGGQALYHETIDQLLGYLTWRHNFGIMLTFVKQKNFSKVLSDAPGIIQQHASYRSRFQQATINHFLSHHKLGQDETKDVEIHHLFYNLYTSP